MLKSIYPIFIRIYPIFIWDFYTRNGIHVHIRYCITIIYQKSFFDKFLENLFEVIQDLDGYIRESPTDFIISWAFQHQVARSLLEFAFPFLHQVGIVHILYYLGVAAPLLVPILPPLGFVHQYVSPEVGGLVDAWMALNHCFSSASLLSKEQKGIVGP